VGIKVFGNPIPFAVGDSALAASLSLLASPAHKKGRACAPIHIFGDLLCGPHLRPNEGFKSDMIRAIEGGRDADSSSDEESDDNKKNGANSSAKSGSKSGAKGDTYVPGADFPALGVAKAERASALKEPMQHKGTEAQTEIETEIETRVDNADSETDSDAEPETPTPEAKAEAEVVTETEAETEADAEAEMEEEEEGVVEESSPSRSPEEEDARLQTALLLAIKYIVKDTQLPLLVSTFWNVVQVRAAICCSGVGVVYSLRPICLETGGCFCSPESL
jgi:hypothetical protein